MPQRLFRQFGLEKTHRDLVGRNGRVLCLRGEDAGGGIAVGSNLESPATEDGRCITQEARANKAW